MTRLHLSGLVEMRRAGRFVFYSLTPLGSACVEAIGSIEAAIADDPLDRNLARLRIEREA